jgi:uncharacterized repeat protein (TIGR03803 family)
MAQLVRSPSVAGSRWLGTDLPEFTTGSRAEHKNQLTAAVEIHKKGDDMKSRLLLTISSLGLLALLAMPVRVVAQEEQQQQAEHLQRYTALYTFTGADGEFPQGNVIRDRAGNLYGTAFNGGDLSGCGGSGCGVVFKLDRSGKETVLYSFTGGADRAYPATGLVRDEAGNLYGTTTAAAT